MFTIKPESKKILGEIVLCKVVEGFFILLAAAALVKFINAPSEKFLLATFGLFAGRFILSGLTEKLFARLSVNVKTSFRIQSTNRFLIAKLKAANS